MGEPQVSLLEVPRGPLEVRNGGGEVGLLQPEIQREAEGLLAALPYQLLQRLDGLRRCNEAVINDRLEPFDLLAHLTYGELFKPCKNMAAFAPEAGLTGTVEREGRADRID